ncbi:MAG: LCP family protein [Actinobacteria bacterium]|nr:LCP family protein [Actinomycetota bacterium]
MDKRKRKSIIVTVIFIILALVLAGIAASYAYVSSVNNKLHTDIDTEALSSVLAAPKAEGDPYYIVLVGTDGRDGETDYSADTILLARIDPTGPQITLVSIPRDTYVTIDGHGYDKINASYAYGGAALAVQTVSKLAGVPIAHYIETGFEGFVSVVDALGGVEVDVPTRIEDPDAGRIIVESGPQTLSGEEALVFCRSRKIFADGDYTRTANQRLFLTALAKKVLSSGKANLVSTVDDVADCVRTDMSLSDIMDIVDSLQGIDTSTAVYSGVLPSEVETIDGVSYVVSRDDEWVAMMERVDAGLSPSEGDSSISGGATDTGSSVITTSDYTVTVWNGAGISGCASDAAAKLEAVGYGIDDIGNANTFVYDETLIVYDDKTEKAVAESIVSALGVGRAVYSSGSYTFTGDLLVVVGKDWTP